MQEQLIKPLHPYTQALLSASLLASNSKGIKKLTQKVKLFSPILS